MQRSVKFVREVFMRESAISREELEWTNYYNTRGECIGQTETFDLPYALRVRARAATHALRPIWTSVIQGVERIQTDQTEFNPTRARFTTVRSEDFSGETLGAIVSVWAHSRYDDGREHVWAVIDNPEIEETTIVPCGEGTLCTTATDFHTFFHAVNTFSGEVYHVHTHPSGTPEPSDADGYALHGVQDLATDVTDKPVHGCIIPMGQAPRWTLYNSVEPPEEYTQAQGTIDQAGSSNSSNKSDDKSLDGGVVTGVGI